MSILRRGEAVQIRSIIVKRFGPLCCDVPFCNLILELPAAAGVAMAQHSIVYGLLHVLALAAVVVVHEEWDHERKVVLTRSNVRRVGPSARSGQWHERRTRVVLHNGVKPTGHIRP
eukprot:6186094-Pleurochrysis_carterae.AAC.1